MGGAGHGRRRPWSEGLPLGGPARTRARQREIRTNYLRFLDFGFQEQVVTGDVRRDSG
jgi:hypothetical protein